MTLRIAALLVFTGSCLTASELTLPSSWSLDLRRLDLQTATAQAAQEAALAQAAVPNDPNLHGWSLGVANQDLGKTYGPGQCAIPLLTTPVPTRNFATRDFKLPPSKGKSPFIHPAMPVCKD